MKMFLTRIGFGSTAVITGDVTQIDLPKGERSGLVHVSQVLKHVEGIGFAYFSSQDVVRHRLVQQIVEAYDAFDDKSVHPFRIRTAAANMTATIELNDACPGHWTPDFNFCLRVLTTACQAVGLNHDVTVSLHFVDAEESLALNSRWREKNTSTNVLSFRADWPEGLKNNLTSEPLGDIVICPIVVEAEAREQLKNLENHWAHMLVHGFFISLATTI